VTKGKRGKKYVAEDHVRKKGVSLTNTRGDVQEGKREKGGKGGEGSGRFGRGDRKLVFQNGNSISRTLRHEMKEIRGEGACFWIQINCIKKSSYWAPNRTGASVELNAH